MQYELLGILIPLAMGFFGAYVHLQIKTARATQEIVGVRELINVRFDTVDGKFDGQNRRLDRIERSMNGHLIRD